jgi:uncharacterized membrane protein (DUF485 family)
MKTVIFILLIFVSLCGFIGFELIIAYNIVPDKWYIIIPLFILSWVWAYIVVTFAENWRNKH